MSMMDLPAKTGDWASVEAGFRAGIKSITELGAEHGIPADTIQERAKRDGWTRDHTAVCQRKVPAKMAMSPLMSNAITAGQFASGRFGDLDPVEAHGVVVAKAKRVIAGDMAELEAMLLAQALTLDGIFNQLARRSASHASGNLPAVDTYMRLALKAQSQSRATVVALADLKHPRSVAFVQQANISSGHQQVNNAAPPARTGKAVDPANKLSGGNSDEL